MTHPELARAGITEKKLKVVIISGDLTDCVVEMVNRQSVLLCKSVLHIAQWFNAVNC